VIHHVLVHMFVHTYMSMYMFSHLSIYITHKHHVYIRFDLRLLSRCSMMFCFCSLLHHDSMIFLPHATPESACCDRCLLITKRPKAPSHYRYLIWVLCYIPYMGLAVFSFAITRVPVYTAILNFWSLCFQRFEVDVFLNSFNYFLPT